MGGAVAFEMPDSIQPGEYSMGGGKESISHYSDGNPNVNANSNGDFNFNLGNFENVWNDNNAFLCFCNLHDFFSALTRRSFVFEVFLPAAKQNTLFLLEEFLSGARKSEIVKSILLGGKR